MAKLTNRCFCYRDFTAAMFVSPRRTPTWCLYTALLQITQEWKTADTWFLARLFIYQSSIISQILGVIHWIDTIFSFDHITGENPRLQWRLVCGNITTKRWKDSRISLSYKLFPVQYQECENGPKTKIINESVTPPVQLILIDWL